MKFTKRFVLGIMGASIILGAGNAIAAASYENNVPFESVVLPESSSNTSFAAAKKATSLDYGRVSISSFKNTSRVSCWLRTKTADGNYHYWTPYIKTITKKNTWYKLQYSDSSAAFYKKGVAADLRGENATQAWDLSTEKVSGEVEFN